ncbi:uncharacterized protein N7515_006147 [Penicillium bovifimosum]|uniref:Mediator of RNA polymerase II transcription subunit 18 n=1 Tax=Penicillium bovifimosum TaxID=126998 RepID=A0A9W9GUE2_9EURO|nr:uncharacterized protein N7515_006147 [Penicillium bovifimosum]KAJ5130108.1 hypothetical protein N7515_006147 [Penicillium bovifimosum]
MHEQSLFASVPVHQHHELLQQLAGLTAMQPRHCLERRLIFKAFRKPGLAGRTGASQDLQQGDLQRLNKMLNGNLYYTQVIGSVSEQDFGSTAQIDQDTQMAGTDNAERDGSPSSSYDYERQSWRLEFRDIPEAGTRSAVTSRFMSSAALPRGDVVQAMNAWGYNFVTEYVVEGDMFVHNGIAIFLHRVLHYPDGGDSNLPRQQLPALKDMTLLEKSGSYVLQAFIIVQDGSNQETMKTASQHLFGLREQLKPAVLLEQADRLSLDTRAK